jgi:hypothetical protein
MDLGEMSFEDKECVHLAQSRVHLPAYVNTVMNFRVSKDQLDS